MKYYSDEGFVEHKIELGDEDLEEIIRVQGTCGSVFQAAQRT